MLMFLRIHVICQVKWQLLIYIVRSQFSQYDMTVTVPVVWTNLTTEELSEYYTASVRVGNDKDGYKNCMETKKF